MVALAMATFANAQITITYRVNMSSAQLGADPGCTATAGIAFDPTADVVEAMGGDYNGWSATTVNCGDAYVADAAVDFVAVGGGIYEKTVTIATFANPADSPFKFRINHAWGNDELRGIGDGNRHLNVSALPAGSSIVVNAIFNDSAMTIVNTTGIKSVKNTVVGLSTSPNPSANGFAKVSYSLNGNDNVTVKVYNVLGSEVATLVNENQAAGAHTINWNTNAADKGVYFVTVKTGSIEKTTRVVVM